MDINSNKKYKNSILNSIIVDSKYEFKQQRLNKCPRLKIARNIIKY